MRVGFAFGDEIRNVGAVGAAGQSVSQLWSWTSTTISHIAQIFEPKERKQLHSVVGAFTITQEAFASSTTQALEVLALISLSLGVINLFPFLPLDGGHVFWAVAEKVRGRRIPYAAMERAERRRLRADRAAVRHRAVERHLDADWVRLQRPLTLNRDLRRPACRTTRSPTATKP